MAGDEIYIEGRVLIFDDLIDEALEFFVVDLSIASEASVTSLVSLGTNRIHCYIIDNDGKYFTIIHTHVILKCSKYS